MLWKPFLDYCTFLLQNGTPANVAEPVRVDEEMWGWFVVLDEPTIEAKAPPRLGRPPRHHSTLRHHSPCSIRSYKSLNNLSALDSVPDSEFDANSYEDIDKRRVSMAFPVLYFVLASLGKWVCDS